MLTEINGHTFVGRAIHPNAVVLDLGANKGAFAQGVLRAFPECHVHAIEANPAMAATIPVNAHLTVHALAIAGQTGPLSLHLSTNPETSSLLAAHAQSTNAITVRALPLPDFVASLGVDRVDLAKFDIEGAEIDALDACSDEFLRGLPQLTIEFHDFLGWTPVGTIKRIVRRLEGLGFVTLKMWRTAWGDTLFVNTRLVPVSNTELQVARYVTKPWRALKRRFRSVA